MPFPVVRAASSKATSQYIDLSRANGTTYYYVIRTVDTSGLVPSRCDELGLRAPRPSYSALQSVRGAMMPTLDDALRRWVGAVAR